MIVPIQHLGQGTEVVDGAAWTAYLKAGRDSMVASWNQARDAYLALKKVRASFGHPLVELTPEGERPPGALSEEEDTEFLYLNGVVGLLSKWADEAIAGKRKGFFESGELMIEALPEDTMRMIPGPNGRPVIVDMDGNAVPVTGTIGNWVIVAGALAATAVAGVALYFAADRMADGMKNVAESRMSETIAREQTRQLELGADPEQVQKLSQGIYAGAAELKKASAEEKETKTGWQQTITTVAWIGFGIAAVLVAGKIVPAFVGGGGGRC